MVMMVIILVELSKMKFVLSMNITFARYVSFVFFFGSIYFKFFFRTNGIVVFCMNDFNMYNFVCICISILFING